MLISAAFCSPNVQRNLELYNWTAPRSHSPESRFPTFFKLEGKSPIYATLHEATMLTPPAYADDFNVLYQQWIKSTAASQELSSLELQESSARVELRNKEASLKKFKEAR